MRAAQRFALFSAAIAMAFAAAYLFAGAFIPDSAATTWKHRSDASPATSAPGHDGHAPASHLTPPGLSVAANGYVLAPVHAPAAVGEAGDLTFTILTPAAQPLTDYTTSHGKHLHLIVVRSDGSMYRHVHPTLDQATGVWSTPWTWQAAGTYRVFADFTPARGEEVVLSRTVDVGGHLTPVYNPPPRSTDTVDGYDVSLSGGLTSGSATTMTVAISKGGQPVTDLQPYLGAFGHLVALRDGDLAYLHVHPGGDEPAPDQHGGPTISFATQAPSAGRYLLYLDFKTGDQLHTATFIVDAGQADTGHGNPDDAGSSPGGHAGHH